MNKSSRIVSASIVLSIVGAVGIFSLASSFANPSPIELEHSTNELQTATETLGREIASKLIGQ